MKLQVDKKKDLTVAHNSDKKILSFGIQPFSIEAGVSVRINIWEWVQNVLSVFGTSIL